MSPTFLLRRLADQVTIPGRARVCAFVCVCVCVETINVRIQMMMMIVIIIIIIIITAIGLLAGGSGYFTCIQNMKLVTNKFKSGAT